MSNQIKEIKKWFEVAIPEPTVETACIQIGCHYEEVSEMMVATDMDEWAADVEQLARDYKQQDSTMLLSMQYIQRNALLDSLCDQIVTAIGVAHMMGFDIEGALAEVNRSNFSKFENGKPVFNEHGKISKGVNYQAPNLSPFIGD